MIFRLSEVVSETPVVELASATLQFKHRQHNFDSQEIDRELNG